MYAQLLMNSNYMMLLVIM